MVCREGQDVFGEQKIFPATKFRTPVFAARSESLYRQCCHARKWRVYVFILIQINVRNVGGWVVKGEEIV